MKFSRQKKHTVDTLFVVVLFCVFALSVVALTGTGAGVYRSIVNDMTVNYEDRTSFSYIINKIHQGDTNGSISIGSFSGCESLMICEEVDNITYCTYLYCHDGHVKEFFTRLGQEFDPSYGTDIFEVNKFELTKISDSLYKFEIETSNEYAEPLYVHVRSN